MKFKCVNTPILDVDHDAGAIGRFTGDIELLRDMGEVTSIVGKCEFFRDEDLKRVRTDRLTVDLTSEGDRVWALCHTDKPGPLVCAVADKIPPRSRSYLTAGKEYKIEDGVTDCSFHIIDDNGDGRLCLWHGCAHLKGMCDWKKVVK